MSEKLNIYEVIFFHLFSSTSRTNKSIPEWSTTIFLATATTLYLMSILIISPLEIEKIGRIGFVCCMFGGIAIHWAYFLKNNRIFKKLRLLKPKINWKWSVVTGLYTFGSFAVILYAVGTRELIFYLIILVIFGLVEISIYIFGNKPIRFD